MKKFELIKFGMQIYTYNLKDNHPSSVKIYFNDHLVIDQPILLYNNIFRISFYEKCILHKKHQLKIVGIDHCKLKIMELSINITKFNNFETQNTITYKKDEEVYTFEFESPYAYYFLNRI
jgi:hypothetical protein